MIPRPSLLSRLVLVAAGLALGLPAQREPGGGASDEKMQEIMKARREAGDGDGGKPEGGWENLTPEQQLERGVRRGASSYCRFVAAWRPEKLLPGQSGTLLVTALLQGQTVLPSPAPIELMPGTQRADDPVQIGALMVRPAEPGTLAKAYEGRPVYENYAVFEIPVTMGTQARIGDKHVVAMDLKFDLYDGTTGQPVGRFLERVSTEVEVGAPLDPPVAGRAAAGSEPAAAPANAAPTVVDDGGDGTQPAEPSKALGGAATLPVSEPPVAPDDATPAGASRSALPPTPTGDDGLPLPLLLGGGVLLVAIALLLLRRK